MAFLEHPAALVGLIFVLGGLGSVIRYVAAQAAPYGLVFVNMAGSVLLGIIASLSVLDTTSGVGLLLATGLCGGLTTFSTVMVLWAQDLHQRRIRHLLRSIRLHLFTGLLAAAVGLFLGTVLEPLLAPVLG
ncbi:fluoride efflux transporter FluC [Micrococcoides hystricis]|uniref:Fluoride-specific ion channel n=1 Tax=Micrococcoides hystricis TaxID=1572761 RepID=A0ABV6PD39_9MICC